jgi:hypothetical protein
MRHQSAITSLAWCRAPIVASALRAPGRSLKAVVTKWATQYVKDTRSARIWAQWTFYAGIALAVTSIVLAILALK